MDLETFKKLHEYVELGLNKSLISKRLGLSYGSITKYSAMTIEEFEKRPQTMVGKNAKLDGGTMPCPSGRYPSPDFSKGIEICKGI